MSEMKFTAGPKWKIQLAGNTGKAWLVLTTSPVDCGTVIAEFPPTTSHTERELCALAPEMAECLKELEPLAHRLGGEHPRFDLLNAATAKARAILARIGGGQ